ncbi:MAG: hypothetical protein JWM94_2991, partial [Sphingomonas bacterium]|nr:hypothetical protein [Sphingomonas bacterium]
GARVGAGRGAVAGGWSNPGGRIDSGFCCATAAPPMASSATAERPSLTLEVAKRHGLFNAGRLFFVRASR